MFIVCVFIFLYKYIYVDDDEEVRRKSVSNKIAYNFYVCTRNSKGPENLWKDRNTGHFFIIRNIISCFDNEQKEEDRKKKYRIYQSEEMCSKMSQLIGFHKHQLQINSKQIEIAQHPKQQQKDDSKMITSELLKGLETAAQIVMDDNPDSVPFCDSLIEGLIKKCCRESKANKTLNDLQSFKSLQKWKDLECLKINKLLDIDHESASNDVSKEEFPRRDIAIILQRYMTQNEVRIRLHWNLRVQTSNYDEHNDCIARFGQYFNWKGANWKELQQKK